MGDATSAISGGCSANERMPADTSAGVARVQSGKRVGRKAADPWASRSWRSWWRMFEKCAMVTRAVRRRTEEAEAARRSSSMAGAELAGDADVGGGGGAVEWWRWRWWRSRRRR